ncbi:hypothetical protein ACQKQC_05895 [Vibrio fortis]|uniref:hypothetical protein n=1 Tax=Vibrio fortis TaxID=212667 RepID=UPI004067BE22
MSENFKQYIESIESENFSAVKKYRSILNKEAAATLFDADILASISKKDVCLSRLEFNSKSTLQELIYGVRSDSCDEVLNELLKLMVTHVERLVSTATSAGNDYLKIYDKHLVKLANSVSNSVTDASRRAAAKKCESDIGKAQASLSADVGMELSNVILKLMDPELIKLHLRECAVTSLRTVLLKILTSCKGGESAKVELCAVSPTSLKLKNSAAGDIELTFHQDLRKIISLKYI